MRLRAHDRLADSTFAALLKDFGRNTINTYIAMHMNNSTIQTYSAVDSASKGDA